METRENTMPHETKCSAQMTKTALISTCHRNTSEDAKQVTLKRGTVRPCATKEEGNEEWHTDKPFCFHKFYWLIISLGHFHDYVLD